MLIQCHFKNATHQPINIEVSHIPHRGEAVMVSLGGEAAICIVEQIIHHAQSNHAPFSATSATIIVTLDNDCLGSPALLAAGGLSALFEKHESTEQVTATPSPSPFAGHVRRLVDLLRKDDARNEAAWAAEAEQIGLAIYRDAGGDGDSQLATEWMRIVLNIAQIATPCAYAPSQLSQAWSGIGEWVP